MSSIYGPHVINSVGGNLTVLGRLQPRVALFLDPNADDVRAFTVVCPATKIVGRIYAPDSEVEDRIRANPEQAAQWAHELAQRNSAVAAGLINWVQVANEVCQFADSLPLLNRFEVRRMQLAEAAGQGCAIGGFSVGQPDLPVADRLALWRLVYPMLERADRSQRRHVLLFHQYGAPDLYGPAEKGGAPWLINRFETQVLPRLPYKNLVSVCGEYGIDGMLLNDLGRSVDVQTAADFGVGVLTPSKYLFSGETRAADGPRGWSAFMSAAEYVSALLKMGQWLEQFSSQMLGYCLFALGHNWPWASYDIAGPVLQGLADAAGGVVTPPVEVPMANDPRASNCRAFHVNASGKVDGIELVWQPVPTAKYACVSAQLITEDAAQGNTVVKVDIFDANGILTAERAMMEWPYGGPLATDSPAGPGNTDNRFTTTSKYTPPAIGPLGFFVADADKQPISDHVWGYGLPGGRHISGYVVFKERSGAVVEPPVEPGGALPEQEPVMAVGLLADKIRWWMEESVRQDEAGNAARAKAIRYSLIRLNGGLLYRLEQALKGGQGKG